MQKSTKKTIKVSFRIEEVKRLAMTARLPRSRYRTVSGLIRHGIDLALAEEDFSPSGWLAR